MWDSRFYPCYFQRYSWCVLRPLWSCCFLSSLFYLRKNLYSYAYKLGRNISQKKSKFRFIQHYKVKQLKILWPNKILLICSLVLPIVLFEKENTDELGQSTSTFANHVYIFRLLFILFGHNWHSADGISAIYALTILLW